MLRAYHPDIKWISGYSFSCLRHHRARLQSFLLLMMSPHPGEHRISQQDVAEDDQRCAGEASEKEGRHLHQPYLARTADGSHGKRKCIQEL